MNIFIKTNRIIRESGVMVNDFFSFSGKSRVGIKFDLDTDTRAMIDNFIG